MKRIVLHRAVLDDAGRYCDAGSSLEVGEGKQISPKRARELVDGGGAVSATSASAAEKAAEAATDETAPAVEIPAPGVPAEADAAADADTRSARRK